jgi:cytochrome c peroxidase
MIRVRPLATVLWILAVGCSESEPAPAPAPPPAAAERDSTGIRVRAQAIFGTLPIEATSDSNPVTEAKTDLGRMLYYDPRLSKSQEISCNSCHDLQGFGVDGEATSPGHRGQRGGRNSPTVYNAAFHVAQFWDGREPDVEAQAKGPVLNPIEMAMPDAASVVAVLDSIPGYAPRFQAAFPGEEDPISYDNMARAIGAFERRLVTPSPFDAWLAGDDDALSDEAVVGLSTFMQVGCITCHMGPILGGDRYQKLGLVKPFPSLDKGRYEVTGEEADLFVFKVPSLRNVVETGPWFHDGSMVSLNHTIRAMAMHQLGRSLSDAEVASIAVFLESLTGTIDASYIAEPELPASGPDTPRPDPS